MDVKPLGTAVQAARHLRGLVSAHELSFTIRRHVTLEQLNKAITEVVNAYLALDLPKVWGTASSVAADGTKYDIYVDNLIAEYHIRYGTGVRTGSPSLIDAA
jgi:TnpA family transposase